MSLETGVHTADKLAHFCCLSTGDGHGRGQRAGSLQDRRLRGDDDWRWRRRWNQRLETSKSRVENNHPLQQKHTRMNPFCRSTCALGLESADGAAAFGGTAAEVATAAAPFPSVARIWPWALKSSWGVTVWTWRPWRGRVGVAAPPPREAGLTNSGSVPITCGEIQISAVVLI